MNDFGTQVKTRREGKGWSQSELARQAKLAPAHINMIEAGKRRPNLTTAIAIADALGIKIDELRQAA